MSRAKIFLRGGDDTSYVVVDESFEDIVQKMCFSGEHNLPCIHTQDPYGDLVLMLNAIESVRRAS